MELKEVIVELQKEAANNPASNAALHVFALRTRTRNRIDLNSLYARMKREGFTNFTRDDYVPLVKTMAKLGLGVIVQNRINRIVGIKDIKYTLQSLGAAAIGKVEQLQNYPVRSRFISLVPKAAPAPKPMKLSAVSLEISINGKSVKIAVPEDLNQQDLAMLISRLR